MTVLSNQVDNDPELVSINQQPSHASNEPSYVTLMSTFVVPSSLLDSPLIGMIGTQFAFEAINAKQ